MSTPAQINDDSLAREFEWLRSAEALEISPAAVWDPDYEEETIRRGVGNVEIVKPGAASHMEGPERAYCSEVFSGNGSFAAVTENQPGETDIVAEEVFAPWSLSEISPQVHVPDELPLKVTEPWSLSEINPQVHVPDELPLKVTEPWKLPAIDPHVGVLNDSETLPDKLSLSNVAWDQPAEPDIVEDDVVEPLPQITPRVRAVDEPEAQTSATPGSFDQFVQIQSLEPNIAQETVIESLAQRIESQILTQKASWATEYLIQVEKDIGKGCGAQPTIMPENDSPIRQLDESQVLPGETSFATVSLNQPSRDIDEETVVQPRRLIEKNPGVRTLDESQVLPGEASFATAISNPSLAPRSYSPAAEFFARMNLRPRTLLMASLLVGSILAVATLVVLEVTTGLFSSYQPLNSTSDTSQKTMTVIGQSEAASDAKSPAAMPKDQAERLNRGPSAPKLERASAIPRDGLSDGLSEGSKSETTRKSSAGAGSAKTRKDQVNVVKSAATRAAAVRGNREAALRGRTNLRESRATKRATVPRNSKLSHSRSEVKLRSRQPQSLKDGSATKPKGERTARGEPKTPAKTNGAQRPRTVTGSGNQ